jgi:hypothetical protein|tara:strand:+ start:10659 stop:11186 length:528 start_codon:yes stop_codon:yes gene_type:complete
MAEEQTAPRTLEAAEADLKKAMKDGDTNAVITLGQEVGKLRKDAERAEQEAKRQALASVEQAVKTAIVEAIKPIYESGQLDSADGIWYTHDFGETEGTIRLLKSAPARRSGAGGGGANRKSKVTTNALLDAYGDEPFNDEMSMKQAHESTTDGNTRYRVRVKMLALNAERGLVAE